MAACASCSRSSGRRIRPWHGDGMHSSAPKGAVEVTARGMVLAGTASVSAGHVEIICGVPLVLFLCVFLRFLPHFLLV